MTFQDKPRIITLEEHCWDSGVAANYQASSGWFQPSGITERLYTYGELRIKEMDEASINQYMPAVAAPEINLPFLALGGNAI